ncbi:MAG: hypothetical protein GX238_11680 [Epulopiscium sp.]|nr:hypothetical protein [Candidatus Epulonipiscium sp.]
MAQQINQSRRPYRVAKQQVEETKNTCFTVTKDKKNKYLAFGVGLLVFTFIQGIFVGILSSKR